MRKQHTKLLQSLQIGIKMTHINQMRFAENRKSFNAK